MIIWNDQYLWLAVQNLQLKDISELFVYEIQWILLFLMKTVIPTLFMKITKTGYWTEKLTYIDDKCCWLRCDH